MTTTTDLKLTRAEAAYVHLASFQRGQQVIVSGRRFSFEGTVTTAQQHDWSDINRAYLVVTGDETIPDGSGGWRTQPTDVTVTVGLMLSGRALTVASRDDAAAGRWSYFDAAAWAMRNPEG